MICQSTIRRFDGAAGPTLHTAVVPQGATGLRFIGLTVIRTTTGRYAPATSGPALTIAWAPREKVSDETSTVAQIDAALADPDHVPLLVIAARTRTFGYFTDSGSSFPVTAIKGTAMALLIRVERIARSTRGQVTLGWEFSA